MMIWGNRFDSVEKGGIPITADFLKHVVIRDNVFVRAVESSTPSLWTRLLRLLQ